jgi:hypothetical protein
MSVETDVVASPVPSLPRPNSLFDRIWPVAGLVVGLIATVAWMAVLGYGLFRLVS